MSKNITSIQSRYEKSTKINQIAESLSVAEQKIHVKGLIGSSLSFVTQAIFSKTENPMLLILDDKEASAYYLNDLEQLINDQDVLFYPGSYRNPYQIEDTDNANILLRAEVLNRINSR